MNAGYFITDKNTKGEISIIYYAGFKLGQYEVYVEHAGAKEESENVLNEISSAIQELISLESIDFSRISN